MPPIRAFHFGEMTIAGTVHTSDLIILPDGKILDNWFRDRGHFLVQSDLNPVFEHNLSTLVIGTGTAARMTVGTELLAFLQQEKIRTYVLPTPKAVETYNRVIRSSQGVSACFHLTC